MHDIATPSTSLQPWNIDPTIPVTIGATVREGNDSALRPNCLQSVLHVVNGQYFAGAERVQMHLGRQLPKFGFQADFVSLFDGRFGEQFDLSQSNLFTEVMRNRFDFSAAKRIADRVRSRGYKLLHAHTPRSAMITSRLARYLSIPWVYHVHSPTVRDSSHAWRNRINNWVERWSLRSASHLITVSNSLCQQMLTDGWRQDQVTVVHNGVPAVRPRRSSIPRRGGQWNLGMVALMRPRKGLEIALEAVQRLRSADFKITLRCIGPFESTEYEQSIHALIKKLDIADAVEFVGFTKDIPTVLASLDAMVLPSLYGEGLPMVVLEAMSAGLPVVATNVEGTPEAIRHGKEGLLAEPNSVESFAQQLRDLVTEQYDWMDMSNAAVTRHAEYFSDRTMAAATATVYSRLLS